MKNKGERRKKKIKTRKNLYFLSGKMTFALNFIIIKSPFLLEKSVSEAAGKLFICFTRKLSFEWQTKVVWKKANFFKTIITED